MEIIGENTPKKKTNTNTWTFANSQENISNQVWAIGKAYTESLKDPKTRPRHCNTHPVQLCKYFYFLYLTGARLMEPVHQPRPQMTIINKGGQVYIAITKENEKHKGMDGNRQQIDLAMPVFNEAEQAMWNYITDGGIETDPEAIFQFDDWKSTQKNVLNGLIKTNFRTALRDERNRVHHNYGITPHILRHARSYAVIVNYGIPVPIAVKWFGWKDERMLYYYADLRKTLNIGSQVDILKRGGFLTGLNVDLGRAVPGY